MSSKELLNPNKFNYAFTETKLQSAKKLKEKPSFPSFQLIFKALKCVWMKYFCVVWYKKVWGPFSISSWELLMFSWWLLQSTTIASFSLRIALCAFDYYLFIYLLVIIIIIFCLRAIDTRGIVWNADKYRNRQDSVEQHKMHGSSIFVERFSCSCSSCQPVMQCSLSFVLSQNATFWICL